MKKLFSAFVNWMLKGIEDATTNPTNEFERRLINQRQRYEKNNPAFRNLVECEIRDAEVGYSKWRKRTKQRARKLILLKLMFIPPLFFILMSALNGFDDVFLLYISLVITIVCLLDFLLLHLLDPRTREINYEKHLFNLSSLSNLSIDQVYENLDKKNGANFQPILKAKISQEEICKLFLANFTLLQKDGKNYYKPFLDFTVNNVVDIEGKQFGFKSLQSSFSRSISNKID